MRFLIVLMLGLSVLSCGGKPKSSGDPLAHCATGSGLCGDGPLYGVSTVAFVNSDGKGHSVGFHLADADTGACPSANLTDATTNAPVDNQVANVLPVLATYIGSAFPTLVQNSVNAGGLFILLEIVGDPTHDKTVDLVAHHGTGAPLLGTDGLMLADQTVMMTPETPLGICKGAKIANGQLSCGPFDLLVPAVVFGKTYDMKFLDLLMTMTLPTDGSDSQLLLGGSVSLANIQAIADEAGPEAGNLMPVIQNVIPSLADIYDPVTHACNRISGAMTMSARTVFATMK